MASSSQRRLQELALHLRQFSSDIIAGARVHGNEDEAAFTLEGDVRFLEGVARSLEKAVRITRQWNHVGSNAAMRCLLIAVKCRNRGTIADVAKQFAEVFPQSLQQLANDCLDSTLIKFPSPSSVIRHQVVFEAALSLFRQGLHDWGPGQRQ